jgi:hypothetical protein
MSSSDALHRLGRRLAIVAAVAALLLVGAGSASAKKPPPAPDFGPNVYIFDPSMPTSQIQSTVDGIAAQQLTNQFGPQRYALLFKPGTYGTPQTPLNFQVGYYTSVAGLGPSPNDVHVDGSIYVHNQCDSHNFCIALTNFWRSLSNLTIDVDTPNFGCHSGEFWAVSQAAPMRRVHVNGFATLMDFCSNPAFASGGFIADSRFDGPNIVNGSQQQWLVRNSTIDPWSNGVWNQVFSGVAGAPAQCFPAVPNVCGPYTTLPTSTVTRDAPYLYVDANGNYNVFVPAVQHDSSGADWESGTTPGTSIPIGDFFIAKPSDRAQTINSELARGKNVIFAPGVYHVDKTIDVKRAGTVVLGLGFPTLVPDHGVATMKVADVPGVKLSGLLFDAGAKNSPVLLEVGPKHAHKSNAADPTSVQDVFFRIGGATPGKATTSLVVNSDNVLLDDIWAWRADHGNGVGWTANTADTGVIVNGDDVTAYGLFVEHYQKYEVIWNGENGRVVFFQNEMPYDPPSQAAWSERPGVPGWAAFKVGDRVKSFNGYGMGSYSFFNQGVDIFAARAFEVPATLPAGSLNDLLTIFLDATNGKGGILHVVNDAGGSSTVANPDVPVTVVSYP